MVRDDRWRTIDGPAAVRKAPIPLVVLVGLGALAALVGARGAWAAQDPVAPGAEVQLLADGFTFTEGPVADAEGGVYFSDVRESRIRRWTPEGGAVLYRDATGGANGLYFDAGGALIVCEGANKRLTRDDLQGGITVITDAYDGRPYNAPNDVWVDARGGIYFTDPNFGGADTQDGHHAYYVSPDGQTVTRVTTDLVQPNGVIGTPDGQTLYLTDSAGPTWRYRIQPDGTLADKARFADQGGDGMSLDERGNVYLAAADVLVFDPTGALIRTIDVPQRPSNVTFGGPDGRTLFITARTGLYAIDMAVRGAYAPVVGGGATPTASATPDGEPSPAPTTEPLPTVVPTLTRTAPAPTPLPTDPPDRWWLYAPYAGAG